MVDLTMTKEEITLRSPQAILESFRFQLTDSEKNELVANCGRFESLKYSVYRCENSLFITGGFCNEWRI
jgi:hypothetical protein